MNLSDPDTDQQLQPFDQWLRQQAVQPRPGMADRVRARLRQSPASVDDLIDQLLRPNPFLARPHMAQAVRQRLADEERFRQPVPWMRWLSPVAAAATLAFAFFSFQTRAPAPHDHGAPAQVAAPSQPASAATNSELTELFALAANLDTKGNVADLQSVDHLAYLFQ
jgi:hypothetical protein